MLLHFMKVLYNAFIPTIKGAAILLHFVYSHFTFVYMAVHFSQHDKDKEYCEIKLKKTWKVKLNDSQLLYLSFSKKLFFFLFQKLENIGQIEKRLNQD